MNPTKNPDRQRTPSYSNNYIAENAARVFAMVTALENTMNHIEKEIYQLRRLRALLPQITEIVEDLEDNDIRPWDDLRYFKRSLSSWVSGLEEVMAQRPDLYGEYFE